MESSQTTRKSFTGLPSWPIMAHHGGARGTARGRTCRHPRAAHHFKRAFKGRATCADSDRWCTTPGRRAREVGDRAPSASLGEEAA
jgi:hypothetical protein